jgi:hypothetical protein
VTRTPTAAAGRTVGGNANRQQRTVPKAEIINMHDVGIQFKDHSANVIPSAA